MTQAHPDMPPIPPELLQLPQGRQKFGKAQADSLVPIVVGIDLRSVSENLSHVMKYQLSVPVLIEVNAGEAKWFRVPQELFTQAHTPLRSAVWALGGKLHTVLAPGHKNDTDFIARLKRHLPAVLSESGYFSQGASEAIGAAIAEAFAAYEAERAYLNSIPRSRNP